MVTAAGGLRLAGTVTMHVPQAGAAPDLAGLPGGSARDWMARLSSAGAGRDDAIAALHTLLLRAARSEVSRRAEAFPQLRGGDQDDLAQQSADDAVMPVLRRLGDFRGDSRFTTWDTSSSRSR
jgi:RNA polymerase sigma-70 factor, ECF subfamily